MNKLVLVIESHLENVDLVGSCIAFLAARRFDEASIYKIRSCVVEAVTNCIKHGYDGAANQQVAISCQLDGDKLVIDIQDTGKAMDLEVFENATAHFDYDPQDTRCLPEGGWGIKLIKAWMDEFHYYSRGGANHWVLTKHARPAGGGGLG